MKGKLIAILLMLLCLGGCSDGLELDDSAHVLSVAVDKGKQEPYRFTFQVPVLMGSEGTVGGEGERFRSISLEAENMMDAFERANRADARYLNFAHLNFFAVSEELARAGQMPGLIASCAYFGELRDGALVVVAEGSAEKFIKGFENEKESNLERLQENLIKGAATSAVIPDTTVGELMEYFTDGRGDGVTALGRAEPQAVEPKEEVPAMAQSAGEEERSGGLGSELGGCALFDDTVMQGKLNGDQTRFLLMLRGEFNQMRYVLEISEKLGTVTLNVVQDGAPKVDARAEGYGITVPLRLRVVDQDTYFNMDDPNHYDAVLRAARKALDEEVEQVNKAILAMGADGWNIGRRLESGIGGDTARIEVELKLRLFKQDPFRR